MSGVKESEIVSNESCWKAKSLKLSLHTKYNLIIRLFESIVSTERACMKWVCDVRCAVALDARSRVHWKNNINNTHKLTLLDVHYLTYQKTTSKAGGRMSAPERRKPEQDRGMKGKRRRLKSNEGRTATYIYLKMQQDRSVKGKTLFNWTNLRERTNSPYDLKWNSRFSRHCLLFSPFCLSVAVSISTVYNSINSRLAIYNQELIT